MHFKTWLEARHKPDPTQGTFWDDKPKQGVEQEAQIAISKYDLTTVNGTKSAMKDITDIAQRYGLSPNELWRHVMHQPEGMSRDIETKEKRLPKSKLPDSEDAFIQNLASQLQTRYGKDAITKAKENYSIQQKIATGQERGNPKHAQAMMSHLQKAISILNGV